VLRLNALRFWEGASRVVSAKVYSTEVGTVSSWAGWLADTFLIRKTVRSRNSAHAAGFLEVRGAFEEIN
jgi:hypothetical protein